MLSGVPLFRDLLRCRRRNFAEGAKEVIGSLFFAMLPIWLGVCVIFLMSRASVGKYVSEFLVSGEALLISAALIGPSIYVITKKYGDLPKSLKNDFPQGWFLVLVSLTICMITAAIFGVQRFYAQLTSSNVSPEPLFDAGLMESFSICILLVTVLGLYLVTVFKNFMEDGAAAAMHSEEDDFLRKWKKRR